MFDETQLLQAKLLRGQLKGCFLHKHDNIAALLDTVENCHDSPRVSIRDAQLAVGTILRRQLARRVHHTKAKQLCCKSSVRSFGAHSSSTGPDQIPTPRSTVDSPGKIRSPICTIRRKILVYLIRMA